MKAYFHTDVHGRQTMEMCHGKRERVKCVKRVCRNNEACVIM